MHYAHMCRCDHVEIAHNDSSDARCPLCRALDRLDGEARRAGDLEATLRFVVSELRLPPLNAEKMAKYIDRVLSRVGTN